MFANTYQNGYYTQIWDSRVNPQKNPSYKQLFKKIPSSLKNFYDKEVKSFIYQLEGNQKLSFPNDDRQQLSLHQRYLVLQIFIPIGSNWSIQLGFNDISNNKKRINITTGSGKQQLKYFSFRYPLQNGLLQKGVWMFLAIDIYSFCNAFKNTVFRSLDSILICSSCKLRRIFTMKEWTQFQIPKPYWLSSNVPQTMQIIQYKQTKQPPINNALTSSVQYTKMTQSKVIQNHPSLLRNSQKSSPLQQKSNIKGGVKLPGVNNRSKQFTPLKSSKLSQKVQLTKTQINKDYNAGLGKSNRSLTKADIIIQKSKIRLNSLQQKQQQIINRLKSEDNRMSIKDNRMSEKLVKEKKLIKNQNLFKSDLFRSNITQSSQSKIIQTKINKLSNYSPKIIKMKKSFEQDNIFKEQSYSSSYSRITQKQSRHSFRNNYNKTNNTKIQQNKNLQNNKMRQKQLSKSQNGYLNNNEFYQMEMENQQSNNIYQNNKQMNKKQMNKKQMGLNLHKIQSPRQLIGSQKQTKISNRLKQRQQIIQQDVWTQDQQDNKKPQTPIQQIIQSHQKISILNTNPVVHNNHIVNNNPIMESQSIKNIKQINRKQIKNIKQIGLSQTVISKQNNQQIITKHQLNTLKSPNQLQLIYDQMIGCYYHPQTNTYYQIKK